MIRTRTALRLTGAGLALALLANCGRHSELDCMQRAMYFESNRSSRDGMVAVGTVVMNRVESGEYPTSVCGVVGQRNQFAPRIMSRKMNTKTAPQLREAAESVLQGERHPLVGDAKFFHAASYRASYNNMHYVVTAGGNAFYERRDPALVTQPEPLPPVEGLTGY
ncbi:cell wall hydrolase [Gemmobacter aquaticus]|jgi:spore germination cell wall hydrolase CwlJ-like protein|uniref:Cell wall hydrolase n=1 Tax=Gemmobacter aquaticus TaxID=490185 RepID=A0A917YML1_9RHOB|nr:cell wall hydrolase [Gemmobacter aquaticus]